MSRKLKKNKGKSGKDRIFGIITTVLVVVIVVMICIFVFALKNHHSSYIVDSKTILEEINQGNYEYAVEDVEENRVQGVDETTDASYEEPYAVADYFQAKMDYKIYSEMGDTEKASAAEKAMKKAYKKMGAMKYKAAEIDELIMGEE